MAKIFISYSRADQDAVSVLVEDLEDDHECWFDKELSAGQLWWDNILSNIRDCEIFLCVLSPDSLESQACKLEREYAIRLGKPPLPVQVSDKVQARSLPTALNQIQIVDYTRQDKQALNELRRGIKSLRRAPPLPDPLPDPPPVPISYLSTLMEKVATDLVLEFKDQILLVIEARDHFREGRAAEDIISVLHRLKKRNDLFAKTSYEIDAVLEEIKAAVLARGPTAPVDAPKDKSGGQLPDGQSENGATRHFQLDTPVEEFTKLVQRVLNHRECWVFEIDPQNCFTIAVGSELETPPSTCCLTAKADLRDGATGAKARKLKALGWEIAKSTLIKSALTGAALYATYGVAAAALLNRGVRDFMMAFEGTRSWIIRKEGAGPAADVNSIVSAKEAAAEFALAMRSVAPETKIIVVKRKEG